ncbi:dethiobiotin synthase [Rheinheimera riviphila]|uniref:ATP-dependent dethiobiotin synthetase BioD n=1 Tax=Rheinheimera riviphila TaxID=1834037 RepID=A0A437R1W7_9GAMM|nr:dethiobiotin synthase [Rheinheimera riviphila]RVU40784.1 dethiobiotin synthase [Rheinheimera riviphila]
MQTVFITGTDTDAGKTYVSRLLLTGFAAQNIPAIGLKPIAAGVDGDGKNADAKILQALSAIALPYDLVNPLLLQAPVAPHLAAANEGIELDLSVLDQQLAETATLPASIRLIEGAGGWLLPINEQLYLADWVIQQQLPVILVVGMKLGCLNHAMLTARELQRSGVPVLGWVANVIDPTMLLLDDNIKDLTQRLPWPRLAVLPFQSDAPVQIALQLADAVLHSLR